MERNKIGNRGVAMCVCECRVTVYMFRRERKDALLGPLG